MMGRWKGIWRFPRGHKGAMPWGVGPIKLHIPHAISLTCIVNNDVLQPAYVNNYMHCHGISGSIYHNPIASIDPEMQTVKCFTQIKSLKLNFTPRVAHNLQQIE